EVQPESDLGIAQVRAEEVFDPAQAIQHGVAMQVQEFGRLGGTAVGREVGPQRLEQHAATVLCAQTAQRVVAKRAQLRKWLKRVEKPVETQVLEGGRAVRSEETAAHGQGLLGLTGAARDLRRSRPDRTVAERDRTTGGARRAMQLLDQGPGFDGALPC